MYSVIFLNDIQLIKIPSVRIGAVEEDNLQLNSENAFLDNIQTISNKLSISTLCVQTVDTKNSRNLVSILFYGVYVPKASPSL